MTGSLTGNVTCTPPSKKVASLMPRQRSLSVEFLIRASMQTPAVVVPPGRPGRPGRPGAELAKLISTHSTTLCFHCAHCRGRDSLRVTTTLRPQRPEASLPASSPQYHDFTVRFQ